MSAPGEGRAAQDLGDLPRWSLYLAALVFLGALAIPMVVLNRRIGRGEKILICALGIAQTAGAAALLVGLLVWGLGYLRDQLGP